MTLVSDALAIVRRGVRAVDPSFAVRRNFFRRTGGFRIGEARLRPGPGGELRIVVLGKAAAAMADAAHRIAGPRVPGIAVTPRGYPSPRTGVRIVYGDHPVSRGRSFRAGRELLEFVGASGPADATLFLISGGGSAVAEVPARPLAPSDLERTSEVLLASRAPIGEMNAIRRHLSRIKGGQLAKELGGRVFGTLALSDVVGDVPTDIGSGPTVGDPTTFRDALGVVRKHRLGPHLPRPVLRYLREGAKGRYPDTPKPGDPDLRAAPFRLAATNRIALEAAAAEARRRRYSPQTVSDHLVGETQPVARAFARRLVSARGLSRARGLALLAGGETTVTLGPHPGRGGRNQEFALAAAPIVEGRNAVVLSLGTDGIDGPTDAAGGWSNGRTLERARRRSVDLERALRTHSTYDALRALGGLVTTGPTGTNVMDLHVGLRRPTIRG